MIDRDRALALAQEVQFDTEGDAPSMAAIMAAHLLAEHEQRVRWEREASNYREAMGNLASILLEMLADQRGT